MPQILMKDASKNLRLTQPVEKTVLVPTLMQKALATLQELHCKKVWLIASPEQKKDLLKLVSFYEKFGFHVDEDGIKNSHYVHEAGMEKNFQATEE